MKRDELIKEIVDIIYNRLPILEDRLYTIGSRTVEMGSSFDKVGMLGPGKKVRDKGYSINTTAFEVTTLREELGGNFAEYCSEVSDTKEED